MEKHNPQIIWEKIDDPFEGEIERIPMPFFPSDNEGDDELPIQTHKTSKPKKEYAKAIYTDHGLYPVNNLWNPYIMWIGYTNFPVTYSIYNIIRDTHGVEVFQVLSRYRFKVSVARFLEVSDGEKPQVLRAIHQNIIDFFETIRSM